ncbi:transcription elongation factor GreB [Gilvimarinus sp. SDUM040013]|uniref:Transcription elongation factor GreB n=1 Tax=Gilvimarinus gilvus TaxID=3058038 RepID=A0ABU4S0Q1_9GAMM|nr:transcription elongation factor GreB [Gilvimarinus sp. SDUM040013]MDO3385887.1 transcription elongation factor GreB [Gilvimarinus sp. SDUM040013]MDX6850610.1 transcription elongation factor GreB [Gilvimarinus sp. SDUM040013]
MGRWRPPRPKGSAYITPEGASALRDELRYLWKDERPKVTEVVHEAAKNGDRSENGDYIYGKKRLREIDSRVRFLTKRLEALTIVDRIPDDKSRVFFGAWVTLEDEDGKQVRYRIVGPDEFNVREGKISMDSPLARAMLKKQIDDEVVVRNDQGERVYYIEKIEYEKYTNL